MAHANDIAVGGNHYKGSKMEHWDYAVRVLNNRYLEGNITKYVLRHRHKNGMQDLDKAAHYIAKLQEEYKEGRVKPLTEPVVDALFSVDQFCREQGLTPEEGFVLQRMAYWREGWHLEQVALTIRNLQGIERARIHAAGIPKPHALRQDEE